MLLTYGNIRKIDCRNKLEIIVSFEAGNPVLINFSKLKHPEIKELKSPSKSITINNKTA